MKLFGTSGIRGPAEELFTNDFCRKLGFTFGTWLKHHHKLGFVATAIDPRESSPRIKDNIVLGLSCAGWEILDQGVVPTPALTYFVKSTTSVAGGIMVTGSHIAAHLNGVKLFIDGEEVTKNHEKEIESLFARTSSSPPPELRTPVIQYQSTARDLYLDLLTSQVDGPYPAWKIVLDTANGAQTDIMRKFFSDINLDNFCTGDCDIQSPHFVARDTEKPTDFMDLMREVQAQKADFGIGFDLDGDRVIFIDELGNYIPGDISCTLIAKYSDTPAVVTPVSSSSVIDSLGIPVFRTPVGSTFVSQKMKQTGATFGFEANGGSISAEFHYGRDGAVTMVKLLNILKKSGKTLSQLISELPVLHIFRDKIDCPFSVYAQIYAAARDKYSDKKIDDTDGVKIFFDRDDWLLFRGSGNAPEFRVFAESPDKRRADALGRSGLELVRSLTQPTLRHTHDQVTGPTDSKDILPSIMALPAQCDQVIQEIAQQEIPPQCYLAKNIVISGMGGSALGGRILQSLERQILKVPIVVSTEYHLPNFVDEHSLVVVSSYSGNTEETLHSLAEARARNAQIFVIASGGQLADLAASHNLPSYIFNPIHNPSGQPRMGLGYNIMALVALLARCQLIHPIHELSRLPHFLTGRQSEFPRLADMARILVGKIPVIISSEHLKGAAHAFQNQLHENAKSFACHFDLPEADHHLIEGLSRPPGNIHNLCFIFIDSAHYHPEVRRRYAFTSQIVTKNHIPNVTLIPAGASQIYEVMDLVQTGAYLAYSLSALYGIDPGPIPWVDWLKENLTAHEIH